MFYLLTYLLKSGQIRHILAAFLDLADITAAVHADYLRLKVTKLM